MRTRINYKGKMTDEYPAYLWRVASEYVLNPFDYIKIIDYLKSKYGRKKPKIYSANIEELVKSPSFVKPKLEVWSETGSSNNGTLYYFKLRTSFEIGSGKDYYIVEQEGFVWVSEVLGQVLERTVKMYDKDANLLVEVK